MNYAYMFMFKAEMTHYVEKFLNFVKNQYSMNIWIFRADNELALGNQFQHLIVTHGIIFEPLAPYTLVQNSLAECSGRVIVTCAHAMRINAKLPENLWPEPIMAAVYLMNLTPIKQLG